MSKEQRTSREQKEESYSNVVHVAPHRRHEQQVHRPQQQQRLQNELLLAFAHAGEAPLHAPRHRGEVAGLRLEADLLHPGLPPTGPPAEGGFCAPGDEEQVPRGAAEILRHRIVPEGALEQAPAAEADPDAQEILRDVERDSESRPGKLFSPSLGNVSCVGIAIGAHNGGISEVENMTIPMHA